LLKQLVCSQVILHALKSLTPVACCSLLETAHEGDPSTCAGGCVHSSHGARRTALKAVRQPQRRVQRRRLPPHHHRAQCDAVAALDGDRDALPKWVDGVAGAGNKTPTPQAKAANGLCSNERGVC